jgi:hypothetical protein
MHRIERDLLPPQAYTTYQIVIPLATHWGPATCEDVDCPHYLLGWQSIIDESTEMGQRQAYYIRKESGRRFREEPGGFAVAPVPSAGMTVFTFEPGQPCFRASEHKAQNGRPERYIQRGGDYRGNPDGRVIEHSGPAPWVDSFGENQERLAAAQERG